jgi:hypothetical protein
MPEDFLDNVANLYETRNLEVSLDGTRFSLINRTTASVQDGLGETKVDLRLRTQFQGLYRPKRTVVDANFSDLSGINAKYFDDCGVYQNEVAMSDFLSTDVGKRVINKEQIESVINQSVTDNHTPFLINMLQSYFKAYFFSVSTERGNENEEHDAYFMADFSSYKDSHVTIDHRISAQTSAVIDLGPPSNKGGSLNDRNAANYFSKPYVVAYNANYADKEAFYIAHLHGRDRGSALNFEFPVGGIDVSTILLDRLMPFSDSISGDPGSVNWTLAPLMWDWICDYVQVNRLEQQFAAAFELVTSLVFQPDPSTQEACAWLKAEAVIVTSAFKPTRARLRNNLTGVARTTDADLEGHLINVRTSPPSRLIRAAIMNYYMWYGLYAIIKDSAQSYDRWLDVFTSQTDVLENLYAPHMRAFAIANVTGQEVPTFMTTGCAFYYDFTNMSRLEDIIVHERHDRATEMSIKLEAIYAPVSGSLLLGTFTGDLPAVQHVKSLLSFTGRGLSDEQYTHEELVMLATIYRLSGNEVTFRDEQALRDFTPWCNVNECIPEPAAIGKMRTQHMPIYPLYSDPRPGRSFVIAQVQQVVRAGTIKMTIGRPSIEPIKYRTAQTPLKVYYQPKPRKPFVMHGKVDARFSAVKAKFTARPLRSDEKGFQVAKHSIPVQVPEGTPVITRPEEFGLTATAPMDTKSSDAEDVAPT